MDKLSLFFLLSFFLDLNHSARCDKTLVFLEQLLDKPQNNISSVLVLPRSSHSI